MKVKKVMNSLPAILLTIFLLSIWEIMVGFNLISSYILPSPTSIIKAFSENWDVILIHTWQTLQETLIGLFIACMLGTCIAILIDLNSWIRKTVYPLLITSQTIPMIALAPLLLLWFGFDVLPKVIIVILYCFFPITIALADGLDATDQDFIKLLKSMGASRLQILQLVKLPGALPSFFSGLKIAVTYSITAAIVGEYVGAYKGLGIYIQTVANSHAISLVFAAIFVVVILSLLLFGVIIIIERIVLPWYSSIKKPL